MTARQATSRKTRVSLWPFAAGDDRPAASAFTHTLLGPGPRTARAIACPLSRTKVTGWLPLKSWRKPVGFKPAHLYRNPGHGRTEQQGGPSEIQSTA